MGKRWAGTIGFEGVTTGDNRLIDTGALVWDTLPIPLRYTSQDVGAHDGAQVVGHIDSIERVDPEELNRRLAELGQPAIDLPADARALWSEGDFDENGPVGKEAMRHVMEKLTNGISMDLDDVNFEVRTQTMAAGVKEIMATKSARVRASTIVAIPAFNRAMIFMSKGLDERAAELKARLPKRDPEMEALAATDQHEITAEENVETLAVSKTKKQKAQTFASVQELYVAHRNWVDEVGGLPEYIKFLATHIRESNPSWSEARSIAVAVNVAKRWARGGTTTGEEKAPRVGAVTIAKAAAAVADWEAKKAAAHVTKASKSESFAIDSHQRAAMMMIANRAAAKALGWKRSSDGCPVGTCYTDKEGWKITLQLSEGGVMSFVIFDPEGTRIGSSPSFTDAAMQVADSQPIPDVDPDNDGDVDLKHSPDDPDEGYDDSNTTDAEKLNPSVKGIEVVTVGDLKGKKSDKKHAVLLTHAGAVQSFAPITLQVVFNQEGQVLGVIDPAKINEVATSLSALLETMASSGSKEVVLFDVNGMLLGTASPDDVQTVQLSPNQSSQNTPAAPQATEDQQAQAPAEQQPAAQAPAPVTPPPAAPPAAQAPVAQAAAEGVEEFAPKPPVPPKVATSTGKGDDDPGLKEVLVYDKEGNPIGITEAQYIRPLTTVNTPGTATIGSASAETEDFSGEVEYWRQVSTEDRKGLAKKGHALPDGSFPIANISDLKNAIHAIGRAKDPAAAKSFIKRRARQLGVPNLIPDDWASIAEDSWELFDEIGEFSESIDLSAENYDPEQRALVASGAAVGTALAAPIKPPKEWFDDPHLNGPTPMTVTADGRVYGHLATFDVCHLAMPNGVSECVTAPKTRTGYSYFHLGVVETEEGENVPVGRITMNTGHAGDSMNPRRALAHYENTGTVIADVHAGEDQYGIWLAGALRPDATPQQIRALKASPLSGDWRRHQTTREMELVMALAVNMPGFPVPRPHGLVASGALQSLFAAGMLPPAQVLAPGTEGALSKDDLLYLKALASRERDTQGAELHERAVQALNQAKVTAFAARRMVDKKKGA